MNVPPHTSGAALKSARLRAGLTREQAASAIARSAQSIAGYELGLHRPHESALLALASAYGAKVAELLEADEGA